MRDSTEPNLEDRMDRYARRELTAAEGRELAQESLDNPELFEELTFSALAKAALVKPPVAGNKIVQLPRRARFIAAGLAAAAAIVLISLYSLRSSLLRQNQPSLTQNQSGETAASAHLLPALASSASPGQPILLASDLEIGPARSGGAPVFRSPEPGSRSPRPAGAIVSIDDGLATINLGSLDGLTKGSELEVFRDERSIGHLVLTTVFRERARGRILAGTGIQVDDRVRAPASVHLDALLQEVDALSGRGNSDAARKTAEKAGEWAETAKVSPAEKRKALERLAALEYQAGALQSAESHYQSAVDSLNKEPQASLREHSDLLNDLAVLRMLRGDYGGAEAPLRQVVSTSPKTNIAYGQSINNLGVLAELRGDRQKAASLYEEAARAFAAVAGPPEQGRQAVETNLARFRAAH